ncbi:MAG: permease [Tissierellia bacterium]|nr:permease [Tissierellia bacterium]
MGQFIQEQVLGMKWLNDLFGNLLKTLGVDITTRLGGALQFFFYDVIKIFILLGSLIFVVSYLQSYFPPEKSRQIIGRFKGVFGNIFAALLGTVTPFCSCSSIPLFMGFTSAGLPLGVTFSFLISSPLVDLGSLVLLTSIFGFRIAAAYVVVGLILAVIGGLIIGRFDWEDQLEDIIKRNRASVNVVMPEMTRADRVDFAKRQVQDTIKKVGPYIFLGVGIGAIIHNYIPQEWIEEILGGDKPWSVILATIVGIPMYGDIFGAIPVAESLYAKSAGLGTVLSSMMAVTALSLPSLIMLRQAIKPKLLSIFLGIVTLGIIAIGYIFNLTQGLL